MTRTSYRPPSLLTNKVKGFPHPSPVQPLDGSTDHLPHLLHTGPPPPLEIPPSLGLHNFPMQPLDTGLSDNVDVDGVELSPVGNSMLDSAGNFHHEDLADDEVDDNIHKVEPLEHDRDLDENDDNEVKSENDLKGGRSESAWGDCETAALIQTVKENYYAIRKKQRNKLTTVWIPIIAVRLQELGYNKTGEQCHVKWKNLLHKYRELKEQSFRNRGRMGLDPPKLWVYYRSIDEIVGRILPVGTSRFVMYTPSNRPTPNLYSTVVGPSLGTRPYTDPTNIVPTPTYYPYTAPPPVPVPSTTLNFDTTPTVLSNKRLQEEAVYAVLSDKLDRVIYLLEKQIELQEILAGGNKRIRLDGIGGNDAAETNPI